MEDKDYKELLTELETLKSDLLKVKWKTWQDKGVPVGLATEGEILNVINRAVIRAREYYGNYLVEKALEGADDE